MGIFYGYQLVADTDALATHLPVALYPNQTVSATTGQNINTAITSWKTTNKPADGNGEWSFSLTLYSDLSDQVTPLMELSNLVYKL